MPSTSGLFTAFLPAVLSKHIRFALLTIQAMPSFQALACSLRRTPAAIAVLLPIARHLAPRAKVPIRALFAPVPAEVIVTDTLPLLRTVSPVVAGRGLALLLARWPGKTDLAA